MYTHKHRRSNTQYMQGKYEKISLQVNIILGVTQVSELVVRVYIKQTRTDLCIYKLFVVYALCDVMILNRGNIVCTLKNKQNEIKLVICIVINYLMNNGKLTEKGSNTQGKLKQLSGQNNIEYKQIGRNKENNLIKNSEHVNN